MSNFPEGTLLTGLLCEGILNLLFASHYVLNFFVCFSLRGEGFGVGLRWVVGGGFPVENKGKVEGCGEGGGEGVGGDRQRNRQINAHTFVKTTL